MHRTALLAALLLAPACTSLSGPSGEIPLAVAVDAEGGAWTLVHAVEPTAHGPTRQYYRLVKTAAAEFKPTNDSAVRAAQPAPALWEADALPPIDGPAYESAALLLGKAPEAYVAGHYPGDQAFLTRVAADGTPRRWALPAGWPVAYALDVTRNAERTWVRPEQWAASRQGDVPWLVEVGAEARTVARDALWMGCTAARCAYVTSRGDALILWADDGRRLDSRPTRREPRFTAACRAGEREYVVTQAELFPVAVTGFGAPVSAPAAWRRRLSEPGELACRATPWLWLSSETGDLYALDATAMTVRGVPAEAAADVWVRRTGAGDAWVSAVAEEDGTQTMSCDPEGAWSFECTATYTKYALRLERRTR